MLESSVLESPIEFLKGVGPNRAELLKNELSIFTFKDLLYEFPFRYIDRTTFQKVKDIHKEGQTVQLLGTLESLTKITKGRRSRLNGTFVDDSGRINLTWFQGANWIKDSLKTGEKYILFGKVSFYNRKATIAHPELDAFSEVKTRKIAKYAPVYSSTELLNNKGIGHRTRGRLIQNLFDKIKTRDVGENLPKYLIEKLKLVSHYSALKKYHLPADINDIREAKKRLKFEELFFIQLRLLYSKYERNLRVKGYHFSSVGTYFNDFFNKKLTFELTNAQKRVLKEIRFSVNMGSQMNRLLQGDVGSGKTIVALMTMLLAIDNGFQCCFMAPTEILAQQHYNSLTDSLSGMGLRIGYLSGTVKGKKREAVLKMSRMGDIDILIGTHALIEPGVKFKNLGLAITDEQHKFGVAQRAKLWEKSSPYPPHVLVMTATPIPRTMAMTIYGDLDVSVIDELPPGRKNIVTLNKTEAGRPQLIAFMKEQIALGRQIYVVYPLIEESEKLDLQNLQNGYEQMLHHFPRPQYQMSVVHGRMKPQDKEFEMQRFVKHETQIMIATTVIEVGVNVPNASVMLIENAERFGLSQLHQLRGRVGRGGDQSYCILMTGFKRSSEAKERIQIMCETNDGFKIAEADLRFRGPGDMAGTQQSGIPELKVSSLVEDGKIVSTARKIVQLILDKDPALENPVNSILRRFIEINRTKSFSWGQIS